MFMQKVFRENSGELLRRPSNQVGNLTVADFNNAKLTISSLNNVHRVEPTPKALGTVANDRRNVTGRGVWHSVQYEVTALSIAQKTLNASYTKATFDSDRPKPAD